MNWIGILLLIIHIIACGGVILIVLLQAGKGASLGASFGGGASQTVFGARSATFIGRATWVLAAAFMLTSLLLTMISPWGISGPKRGSGILQEEPIASPPLGEENYAIMPESSPLPGDVPGGTEEMQREETTQGPIGLPIEGSPQPEPGAPAVVSETQAAAPDGGASMPDASTIEPEQH